MLVSYEVGSEPTCSNQPILFKQKSFEEHFHQPDYCHPEKLYSDDMFQEQTLIPMIQSIRKINKQIKKQPKPTQTQASRDYSKNICRNILRHAVKSMLSSQKSKDFLYNLLKDETLINDFVQYYNKHLEQITGFRVLKAHLLSSFHDDARTAQRKLMLRKYLTWFLMDRASLVILLGETNNPREYIRYKNEVLLYYVQQPEEWCSNKALWKERTVEASYSQNIQIQEDLTDSFFRRFTDEVNLPCT